jgi:hypothetical protein
VQGTTPSTGTSATRADARKKCNTTAGKHENVATQTPAGERERSEQGADLPACHRDSEHIACIERKIMAMERILRRLMSQQLCREDQLLEALKVQLTEHELLTRNSQCSNYSNNNNSQAPSSSSKPPGNKSDTNTKKQTNSDKKKASGVESSKAWTFQQVRKMRTCHDFATHLERIEHKLDDMNFYTDLECRSEQLMQRIIKDAHLADGLETIQGTSLAYQGLFLQWCTANGIRAAAVTASQGKQTQGSVAKQMWDAAMGDSGSGGAAAIRTRTDKGHNTYEPPEEQGNHTTDVLDLSVIPPFQNHCRRFACVFRDMAEQSHAHWDLLSDLCLAIVKAMPQE